MVVPSGGPPSTSPAEPAAPAAAGKDGPAAGPGGGSTGGSAATRVSSAWKGDDPKEASVQAARAREDPTAAGGATSAAEPARRKSILEPCNALMARLPKGSQVRGALQASAWYKTPLAAHIRSTLHGKFFAVVMSIALALALLMSDIWVIAGISDNLVIDVVLTIVMVLFSMEFLLLSVTDGPYLLSFFWLMDIIGTVSMVFDLSYMYGQDATREQVADGDSASRFMLLRAARAARVGARAGRLSRVLRFLRFLPFLAGGNKQESVGMASVISSHLSNLLATRVACLTILLVMVIPLFELGTFPQYDHSLQTWVDRLSVNLAAQRTERLTRDLDLMAVFFEARFDELGPYRACTGRPSGGEFVCDGEELVESLSSWSPLIGAPNRENAGLVVHTDTIGVFFNMFKAQQLSSGLAIVNTFFIIFIMVFSGMALSSVVTELAVRPLERMLSTVREIATTVFKFSEGVDVENEDENEEEYDINSASEMKLLERVVQKLAIIAQLQSSTNVIEKTEDMDEQQLGVLSMLQGKNVVDEAAKQGRRSMAFVQRKRAVNPQLKLEEFGVSQEEYESWSFNALVLSKGQRTSIAMFTITSFHNGEGYIRAENEDTLLRFLQAAEREYLPNPFHNFAHAIDVCHGVARQMRFIRSENFLTELEQFSLLIAAVGHDLGHPGVTNGFLLEVGHELAIQYNDRSPLENMHCSKLYQIVTNADTNVFCSLTKDQFKEVRKICIESILHTDITLHGAMVKDLQLLYQMNSDVFNAASAEANARPAEESDSLLGQNVSKASMAEMEVFNKPETKTLILLTILHSADVSNPCRSWEVTKAWAHGCLEEFFAQGDREKMLDLPVGFLNDREKLNKPNSQIGFLEGLITPLVVAQIRIWPALYEMGDNLGANIANWRDVWATEVNPSEEELVKVAGRVLGVQERLEDAKHRRGVKAK